MDTLSTTLLAAIFLPLLGAALLWVVQPLGRDAVRYTALAVTMLTAVIAVSLCLSYVEAVKNASPGEVKVVASTDYPWLSPSISSVDVKFSVGLDGLGVWMFGLSAILMVTAVLVSWQAIKEREALFYGMLLLLEFGCLGVFTARDLLLFYIFFEFTLIPLFFLIGIWGSEDRRYAAIKFFLFTLAGSMLTFLGLLAIVVWDYQQQGHQQFRFGIESLEEAKAYLNHPLLGKRLLECVNAIRRHQGRSPEQIFSPIDAIKFRSCLTLFKLVAGPESVFAEALKEFYRGQDDEITIGLLAAMQPCSTSY